MSTDLTAADTVLLKTKDVDRSHALLLAGSMAPYHAEAGMMTTLSYQS